MFEPQPLYFIKKEEVEKREKETAEEKKKKWEKWEKASPLKRIFTYHPDVSSSMWYSIIFPWNLGFVGSFSVFFISLIFLNEPIYIDSEPATLAEKITFIGICGVTAIFCFLFSYALSHFKKWVMVLYSIFSIFAFVEGLLLTKSIFGGLIGGLGVLLVYVLPQVILILLFWYDRFR